MADMANRLIGKNFTPPDLRGKVTGQAKYAEDFRAEGMVFCRLLTSPMPRWRSRRRPSLSRTRTWRRRGASLASSCKRGASTARPGTSCTQQSRPSRPSSVPGIRAWRGVCEASKAGLSELYREAESS